MQVTAISVEEARQLAARPVEEALKYAYTAIRKAATEKKYEVNLTSDFWVYEGYNGTKSYAEARNALVDKGFTVEFFYEERQFVNMYTIVRW